MNIFLLEQDEVFIKNIHPNNIEITETNKKDEYHKIKFKYFITEDIETELSDFSTGNKIFVQGSKSLKDCLYVINGQINNNLWTEGYIEGEAEEVLVELNYTTPISQLDILVSSKEATSTRKVGDRLKKHFVVTKDRLKEFFDKHYNIGVVETGVSSNAAIIKGVMSKMEVLRAIEKQTGNIFVTEYKIKDDGFTIERVLHLYQPKHIGDNFNKVLDTRKDAKNFRININESEVFSAVAPRFKVRDDKTIDNESSKYLTDEELDTIIKRFTDLDVKRTDLVPHMFSDERDDVYPVDVRENYINPAGDVNSQFWKRTPKDETYNWCPDDLKPDDTPKNKEQIEKILKSEESIAAYGNRYVQFVVEDREHFETGEDVITVRGTFNQVKTGDMFITNGKSVKLHRQKGNNGLPAWQDCKISYVYATKVIPAQFSKMEGEIQINDYFENQNISYSHITERDDYVPADDEDTEGNDDINTPEPLSEPKVGFLDVNSQNEHEIYDKLCIYLREHRNPKIEVQSDIHVSNAGRINVYDRFLMKIKGFKDIIPMVVVKTEKTLHKTDKNKIELQFAQQIGINPLLNTHFVLENKSINHSGYYTLTGRLITLEETMNPDGTYDYVEKGLANKMIGITRVTPEQNYITTAKTIKRDYKPKWDKWGRSANLETLLVIGRPASAATPRRIKKQWGWWEAQYSTNCPYCEKKKIYHTLYYSIFHTASWNPVKNKYWKHSKAISRNEGLITCGECGADFDVFGNECDSPWKKLKTLKKPERVKGYKKIGTKKKKKKVAIGKLKAEALMNGEVVDYGKTTPVTSDISYKTETRTVKEKYVSHRTITDENGYFTIKSRMEGKVTGKKKYKFNCVFAGDDTYAASEGTLEVTPRALEHGYKTVKEDAVPYITCNEIKRTNRTMQAPPLTQTVINQAKSIVAGATGEDAIKKLAEWCNDRNNVRYGNYHEKSYRNFRRSPTAVLTKKNGKGHRYANCCDTTMLFLSMCEALNLSGLQSDQGFLLEFVHMSCRRGGHVIARVNGVNVDCVLKKNGDAWGGLIASCGRGKVVNVTEYPNLPFKRNY